jgi:hypothetical protein
MEAWAVLLASSNWQRIFCVFAKSEAEALGNAFSELNTLLNTDMKNKGEMKDYKAVIWCKAKKVQGSQVPNQTIQTTNFDEQIMQIRKK